MTKALATMTINEIVAKTNYVERLIELGNYPDNLYEYPDTHNYNMGKEFLELHKTSNDVDEQLILYNDLTIEQLSCLGVYITDYETSECIEGINLTYIKDIVDLTPGNFKLIKRI